MENPTDYHIKEVYSSLEANVKSQGTINDSHTRNMATLAANTAFDSFKVWFGDDLTRLGLETRMSWQVMKDKAA